MPVTTMGRQGRSMPTNPLRTLRRPGATIAAASVAVVSAAALAIGLGGCSGVFGGGIIDTSGEVEFINPLAIPPVAASKVDKDGSRVFDLTATAGTTEFRAGTATRTWGFNQSYLGPTLLASRGEHVKVNVTNALDEPTTVHWHGMHLPARMDGGPHQIMQPGATWQPEWTIDQPAATLWYHPHPHGETERHVDRGLAGMVILSDDEERALTLPREYGVDDIPVIVQDRRFDDHGQFTSDTRGFIGPIGNEILVNGTLGPYLDVSTDSVRLRLLNASSARVYNFAFEDARQFDLIATDGGLLPKAVPMRGIRLSPGERAEIVVRLAPGEDVTLRSTPPDLGLPGPLSASNAGEDTLDVLQLRAADALRSLGTMPTALATVDRLGEGDQDVTRSFALDGTQINQQRMDISRVDETVELGSTEVWSVTNGMSMPHSFHVHDVQFQVLSIGGREPPPHLAGWKDTVYLEPNVEYRLIMTFTDYADADHPYMYHCHLLAHEDSGMMGQFVVVRPGESAGVPPTSHDASSSTAGTSQPDQENHHDH